MNKNPGEKTGRSAQPSRLVFSRHPTSCFSPSFADHVPQQEYRLPATRLGILSISYLGVEVRVTRRRTSLQMPAVLRLDDLISHGITNQLAHRMNFKLTHDVCTMGFRGLYADA